MTGLTVWPRQSQVVLLSEEWLDNIHRFLVVLLDEEG